MADNPDTLPADFFSRPGQQKSSPPNPETLPADFFSQGPPQLFSKGPSRGPQTLPQDLPEKAGRFLLKSAPYIGGTVGAMLAPEGVLPAVALSALGGAGGSAVEQGVRAETGEDAPGSLREAGKRIGKQAAIQGVTELGGQIVTGVLGRIFGRYVDPEWLYQSGLKPSGTSQLKSGRSVVTGIREGIPVTEKGAAIARGRIANLNTAIENTIANSPANIPPTEYVRNVEAKLDVLRRNWSKDATHGAQFVDTIDDFERDFLLQHGNPKPITRQVTSPPTQQPLLNAAGQPLTNASGQPLMRTVPGKVQMITIQPEEMSLAELRQQARPLAAADAQAIKKQTYQTIRTAKATAWDPGAHPGLSIEANQEIARALKEELEQVYPQLGALNRREGALIDLEQQLQRFTKREMNKQRTPYFIFPTVGGLAGAALGGAAGGAARGAEGAGLGAVAALGAHLLRSALEDPAVKSRIAIAIDRAAQIPGAAAAKAVARQLPAGGLRLTGVALTPTPPPTGQRPTATKRPNDRLQPSAPAAGPARPRAAAAPGMKQDVRQALADASARLGVPLGLVSAVARNESGGDARAVSPKGAQGVMQLKPETAAQYGVRDPFDARQNIEGGVRFLRDLMQRYHGDLRLVLAAYNAGPGAVDRYGGVPPYPETQTYVQRGLARMGQ